jgi:hypothetical protein
VSDIPPEVDDFICTLLDKNSARRPATAAAVLEELERIRGKLERKGEALPWPAKLQPDTAEMPALSATLAAEEQPEPEPSPRPLMKRPLVVFPLFLLVVGVLIAAFTRPKLSAAELHAAAQPLLASEDPADWERAWEQYLMPLSERYPGQYVEEVSRVRIKVHDRREQRRVLAEGARVEPRTDTERFYLRGLRLAQAGDTDMAKAVWRATTIAFEGLPAEKRWVDLARAGLATMERATTNTGRSPIDRGPLEAAIERAKTLPPAEAETIFRSLEELCRDDAIALATVKAARPKR